MMDFITVPLIIGIITLGIYRLFELFACRRERMMIIEKMSEQFFPPICPPTYINRLPFKGPSGFSFGSLKAGCLLIGIGLGLLIGFMISLNYISSYTFKDIDKWDLRRIEGLIYGASVLLFGGIGLILAFIVEIKLGKKKEG